MGNFFHSERVRLAELEVERLRILLEIEKLRAQQTAAGIDAKVWRLSCTLVNGRTQKGFNATLFRLAEDCFASAQSVPTGIANHGKNVTLTLFFGKEEWMLKFETALFVQCASTSANKRPKFEANQCGNSPDESDAKAAGESIQHQEVRMASLSKSFVDAPGSLVRVYSYDYQPQSDDNASHPSDSDFDAQSLGAHEERETVTTTEAETRVQMIETHLHDLFVGKNAEVVHIKDKSKCTFKEEKDVNNHLHMSSHVHDGFDGINTIPHRFPHFIVHYVSHDADPVDCPKIGDDAVVMYPFRKRYHTIVHVQFYNEKMKNSYLKYLRNNTMPVVNNPLAYEQELYFEDPIRAKKYLDWKELKTRARWEKP